jgi:hypothetical protein
MVPFQAAHLEVATSIDGVPGALEVALQRPLPARQLEASAPQTEGLLAIVVQLHTANDQLLAGDG